MCNGFPGRLFSVKPLELEGQSIVRYQIQYNYIPFLDRKYGNESTCELTWGRVLQSPSGMWEHFRRFFFWKETWGRNATNSGEFKSAHSHRFDTPVQDNGNRVKALRDPSDTQRLMDVERREVLSTR